MTTTFFGEPWPSGVCEEGTQAATPVGVVCLLCEVPIAATDRGWFIYDVPITRQTPVHRECMIRTVIGGIGHLEDHQRWCVGVGDPDGGRSYRESALEVWAFVQEHGFPR